MTQWKNWRTVLAAHKDSLPWMYKMLPVYEKPWPLVSKDKCYFYHSMKLPGPEQINGSWAIDSFSDYIGGYDLSEKSVLEVGTASGYLAFSAEMAGADVTAIDAATTREFRHVPFAGAPSYEDVVGARNSWTEANLIPIKNSWWYSWHKLGSKVKCVYTPIADLYEWDLRYDVVIAGAIVEHLSDPVYAIGAWTKVAKEAVLIPFTDIAPGMDLYMKPMTDWIDPEINYAWWQLSEGLYRRIFDNLGFDVEIKNAQARLHQSGDVYTVGTRPSIIARRRQPL